MKIAGFKDSIPRQSPLHKKNFFPCGGENFFPKKFSETAGALYICSYFPAILKKNGKRGFPV